jgi:hypothetical protein
MHCFSGAENDNVRNAWLGRQLVTSEEGFVLARRFPFPRAVSLHEEDCGRHNVSANIRLFLGIRHDAMMIHQSESHAPDPTIWQFRHP